MARTYRRDTRGRFASGGGSGGKGGPGKGGGGKAKPATTGKAKPKATSKPAAGKSKSKAKPAATKPSPAAKSSRKPATSKPKATATRKPSLPPAIPEALLKAAGVTNAAMRQRRKDAGIANNIRPSPRQHTPAEAAYWDIAHGKGKSKFRSSKKVREEMRRRGFLKDSKDPQGDLIMIASRARIKKGLPY